MDVRVTAYGMLRDLFGARSFTIPVAGDAPTAGDVLDALCARWPAFDDARRTTAVAIGDALVDEASHLGAGDELALLPPVSGG